MEREISFFYLASAILVLGFFLLFGLFIVEPFNLNVDARIVGEKQFCEDGTEVGECSEERLGNACKLTREGPDLRFSEKCYE